MKTTSQMSHTRPFRWRRKQEDEQQPTAQDELNLIHNNNNNHHHHQHLTLRSSAIGHHHHQSLSYEQNSNMSDMNACGPHRAAAPLPPTITHSRRYSQTPSNSITAVTTTETTTIMGRWRRRRRLTTPPTPSTSALSLPMLMSLSIIVCVISSLLNLTIDQMQPKMVVAIGTSGTIAASATGQSTPSPSQANSAATLQQQQQSNSVIQYNSNGATATTSTATTTKAKYKTMYACEDRQLTMDCETGSKINLIRANFGRFSITQCNEQGQLDLSTDCMSPITFRIMQERCQDRQRCSVNATSVLFGDRCPKTRKYLEVHFQCQMMEPDVVDVRKQSQVISPNQVQPAPVHFNAFVTVPKPPNNPTTTTTIRHNTLSMNSNNNNNNYEQAENPIWAPSHPVYPSASSSPATPPIETNNNQPTAVINSAVMTPAMALNYNQFDVTNKLPDLDATRGPIIVSLAHLQVENMARPRCFQWDSLSRQWTERGARFLETNQTHTTCAFDQQSSYVLVMDYSGPNQSISPNKPLATPQPSIGGSPIPDLLESQPIPIDNFPATSPFNPANPNDDTSKMIHPPTPDPQQNQQQQASSAKLFLYLLGIIFVALALMTLTFVASSMRSSAGAALKSLGNFAPFSGPKYKHRRQTAGDPSSLHSNKDLLVINNSNGHSFIYAPASTTKISSSSSTHILSTGQPVGLNNQHQAGTLHRLQQQQMYSGNGATLSSLSGTGAQSNNYYYGLMGLNPLLQQQQQQQQQQQHHFSQHHLNQPQPQQAQLVGHQQQQQQVNTTASYNHQANKSSVSNDSANSSASSSGVESGSASMQQQQQARTQQACLVSAMNNNDFHLMGHHISNYGQHQPQQHNLFATLKGASVTHQPHQHQPTFTVNAHYSTSGGMSAASAGLQSINMTPNQASAAMLHSRQASNQMRDHIYECVDDEKPYMARLLMPTQTNSQHQIFGSPTFMSARRTTTNECGARQK